MTLTLARKPSVPAAHSQVIIGLERLGSALRAQAWSEAFVRGLTPTQGQVLVTLAAHKGPGLRLSGIAEALNVTAATASEAVTTLVQKGFVIKRQAVEDARAVTLSLSKAGVAEAAAVESWPSFLLEAVDQLAADDRATLLRSVVTIISSLQRSGRIPVAQMCVNCRNFQPHVHAGPKPHHCRLIDAPVGDADLRTHCAEHELASAELQDETWQRFRSPPQTPKRRLPVVEKTTPPKPTNR
jgi:DNA-binding MarR family transcriptional regulator